jgi:hypothetical protein
VTLKSNFLAEQLYIKVVGEKIRKDSRIGDASSAGRGIGTCNAERCGGATTDKAHGAVQGAQQSNKVEFC